MMRHVVYTNQKWEATYPIATYELGAIAVVAILIVSAVITPTTDPFTMLAVALPLYLLYEVSIMVCRPKQKEEDEDE